MTTRILRLFLSSLLLSAGVGATLLATTAAGAATGPTAVDLYSAASFGVLAATTVTNTGPTIINGDLGLSPGTSVTGFPPGTVNGTVDTANTVAAQAQTDLTTAYNDAAGRSSTGTVTADLAGQTLVAGVYSGGALALNGTLTLNGQNNANAVFIFQAASTLITGSGSVVTLENGAQACNVFWQVGSSATLGTSSVFAGTILASASITGDTSASVDGRLLARSGAVTLDANTVTTPTCAAPTTTTTTTTATPTPTPTPTATATATPTPTATATATATPVATTTTTPTATPVGTTTAAAGGTAGSTPGQTSTVTPLAGTTPAAGTTPVATSTPVGTTVPATHTGEAWAGWPYWLLVAVAAALGVGALYRARRHAPVTPREH